jgi:uncharacterized repeat protein (TIGR01451 family)
MRRGYALAGLALLTAGLVGWVALASGQQNLGKLPPTEPPLDPGPAAPTPAGPPRPGGAEPAPPAPLDLPGPGPGAAPVPPQPVAPGAAPQPVVPQPAPPAVAPAAEPSNVRPATFADPSAAAAVEEKHREQDFALQQAAQQAMGRQEPAVSLEWVGPLTAKLNQPAEYSLVVRNICTIPVQQVMVRVRLPEGLGVQATEPKAITEGNVVVWELGTLLRQQERQMRMRLVSQAKGDLVPQAWVTFTGSALTHILVREPKLALKISAPEKLLVGDTATFALNVTNPGDGPAEQVKIQAVLSEGLEHARGSKVDFDIGNLAPGETRSVQVLCATKTGGEQKCEGVATAEGGLTAKEAQAVNVIMPRLDLQVVGPALRYLERKAVYAFKVTNPGDAPATNVSITETLPAGFKFVAASDGGRHDFATSSVNWFLGKIDPGQTREVKLEVVAANAGEFRHHATATAARGLKVESELTTRVEGLSALLLEVVDTEDPIEVGNDTSYEVRVTNTGSKTETDIRLTVAVPEKMQFKGAQGPVRYHEEGKTVIFEPVAKLAPRADAIFRLNVKALSPGDVRFKVQVTSTHLVEPVIEMEATRLYSDAPEKK